MSGFDVLAAIERAENHCVGQAWDLGLDLREARARVEELISAIQDERNLRDLGSEVDGKTLVTAMSRTSAALRSVRPPA